MTKNVRHRPCEAPTVDGHLCGADGFRVFHPWLLGRSFWLCEQHMDMWTIFGNRLVPLRVELAIAA